MPITRTPIYDDSGLGKDGTVIDNAWKQELYNQIDALAGGLAPVVGPFTPTDASGAGLVFTAASGFYWKLDRLVYLAVQVIYPGTANGLPAKLGGLPFVISDGHASLYHGYGSTPVRCWGSAGASTLDLYYASTGTAIPNSGLTGVNMTLYGTYLTTV
jgi:hypothetical protein